MPTLAQLQSGGQQNSVQYTVSKYQMDDNVALDKDVITSGQWRMSIVSQPHEQFQLQIMQWPVDMRDLKMALISFINENGQPVTETGDVANPHQPQNNENYGHHGQPENPSTQDEVLPGSELWEMLIELLDENQVEVDTKRSNTQYNQVLYLTAELKISD